MASKTDTIRAAITKLDAARAKAPADQQPAIEIARSRMVRALEFSPAVAAEYPDAFGLVIAASRTNEEAEEFKSTTMAYRIAARLLVGAQ